MSEPPFGADMPHEADPPAGWRANNHTYDPSSPEPMYGEGLAGSTRLGGGMPRVHAPPGFQQGSPWPAAPIPMPGTIHGAPDASMPPGWAPRASGATAQEAGARKSALPESIELVQHMGHFASLLLGLLQEAPDNVKYDAGGNPSPDYSGIPKGAGKELRSYEQDEAKKAAGSVGANVLQYEPYDQQVKDLDLEQQGLDSGRETMTPFNWQQQRASSVQDQQISRDVDTQVYGPDVASAPHGGMHARAE